MVKKESDISLVGKNINIADDSFILSQSQSNSSNNSININASETLKLFNGSLEDGIFTNIRSEVLTNSDRQGANINIFAEQLIVRDLATIQAATFSDNVDGLGGDININTAQNAEIDNGVIATSTAGRANSGDINFSASSLQMIDSATITSVVSNTSTSNGGDVKIDTDSIEFTIERPEEFAPPLISASTLSNSEKNPGNAGNLIINTSQLTIEGEGILSTSSLGNGNAGNIFLNASELIEITGVDEESESVIRSTVQAATPEGRQILGTPEFPTGNSGKITVNTPTLNLNQYGIISAENLGLGSAGTIVIDSQNLNLNEGSITSTASNLGGNIFINSDRLISNNSNITAESLKQQGGNITIESDRFSLNNSLISAEAGGGSGGNIEVNSDRFTTNNSDITAASSSQRGGNLSLIGDRFIFQDSNFNASAKDLGDGGNVTINADTVLGINSDITATAVRGDGGNVIIDADGVLGFREANAIEDNGVSEVDVTSQFGTDGVVVINNPLNTNSDPLVLLVTAPQRNNDLPLRTACENDAGNGEAYLTDSTHPNIPDSPETYLDNEDVITEEPVVEEPLPPSSSVIEELLWKPGKPYALADIQIQTPDGRIFAVNREQLMKMQQRGCVDVEVIKN